MSGLSPQAGSAARAELMKYTGRGVNKKNIMKDKSHQEKSGDSWRRARSNAGASPTNRSPARKRDGKSPPRTSRGKSPPRATETEMEKIREEEEGSDQGETREGSAAGWGGDAAQQPTSIGEMSSEQVQNAIQHQLIAYRDLLVQQGVDDPAHQQAYLEQYNAQLQAFMWEQQQQQLFAQQQAAAAAAKAGPEPEAQVAVAESRAGAGAGGKKPSRFGLSAMLATFDVGGKKEAARLEAEAAAPAPTAKTAPMAASKAAPPALAFASPFAHESGEVSAGVAAAAAAAAEAVGHDPELLAGLRECCAATKGLNLRAIFKQYDKGGDNSLNRKEFTAFLSKSGVKLGKSQFDKLVKLLDPDGSGELSYPKFTKFMRVFRAEHEAEDADVKETRRRQKAALQKLQDDRNASKAANFRRRGAAPEPEEAPKAASETERSAGLEKLWVKVSQYVSSGPGAVSGSTGVALLEDMFERFDVDGDGQLTTEELVDGLSSAGITTSKKTFKLLMAELDRDGTGQISLKEWSTGLQKRTHR